MTEPEDINIELHEQERAAAFQRPAVRWVLVSVVVFGLAVGAGYFIQRAYPDLLAGIPMASMAPSVVDQEGALPADVVAKLQNLEQRLKTIEEKEQAAASAPATAQDQAGTPPQSAEDIKKLQAELASVSTALAALQTKLDQSAQTTSTDLANAQAGMASIIAFIQLQKAALSGDAFEVERQTLRKTIGQDEKIVDLLVRMEPLALRGVVTPPVLLKEWRQLSTAARAALRKASAQTWRDRIVVALEGLVSIKSLSSSAGEPLSFTAIDLDLEQNKLATAMEKISAMPPSVQEIIKDWRAKLQSRVDLDSQLSALAARLIERGGAAETPAPVPVEPTPAPLQTPPAEPTKGST
ncbi:MAG TPA: hypothetical protein DCY07_02460 [Rhodospirillaceae bacterium]|nr:hypothetical protein [Rhodospirillaceae bacterium]